MMKNKNLKKEKYRKILLYVSALVLFFWFGLTHIFFKEFYFNDLFGVAFNAGDDFDNEASEIIGVLCIALAYGAFLAARYPSKNTNLIKVLIIAAVGCGLVLLYNILTGIVPASLLFNVSLLFLMAVAVMILYPKMEVRIRDDMDERINLTVDAIIFSDKNRILLIRRFHEPFKGWWALPGGFVEYGERVENAIVREVKEETGLHVKINRLIGVYSDPGRDPRGHTVSVVFECTCVSGRLTGGDDADKAQWFDIKTLDTIKLAFDHRKIIGDTLNSRV